MRRAWLLAGLLGMAGAPALAQDGGAGDVSAQEWLNSDGRTSLADFRGQVVLVEQFATW